MSELKPCPFCGSEGKLYKDIWDDEDEDGISYYVKCTGHCFCETWYYSTEQEAIDAWQRRVGCEPAGEHTGSNRPQDGSWRVGEGEKG